MILSAGDLMWIRGKVGSLPDDVEIRARYETLGTRGQVARSILSERLADLSARPARIEVVGEFTMDNAANIAALERALQDEELYDEGEPAPVDLRLVPPVHEGVR